MRVDEEGNQDTETYKAELLRAKYLHDIGLSFRRALYSYVEILTQFLDNNEESN